MTRPARSAQLPEFRRRGHGAAARRRLVGEQQFEDQRPARRLRPLARLVDTVMPSVALPAAAEAASVRSPVDLDHAGAAVAVGCDSPASGRWQRCGISVPMAFRHLPDALTRPRRYDSVRRESSVKRYQSSNPPSSHLVAEEAEHRQHWIGRCLAEAADRGIAHHLGADRASRSARPIARCSHQRRRLFRCRPGRACIGRRISWRKNCHQVQRRRLSTSSLIRQHDHRAAEPMKQPYFSSVPKSSGRSRHATPAGCRPTRRRADRPSSRCPSAMPPRPGDKFRSR